MSIVTVSTTNKLPFAIQTILGDDDRFDGDISRENCDRDYLSGYPDTNSIIPVHIPHHSTKSSAVDVTTMLPSFNHCKFIDYSDHEIQNCYYRFLFTQYLPMRYEFPSTSTVTTSQIAQSSKFNLEKPSNFSDIKFEKLLAISSNQSSFFLNSDLSDVKIIEISGNEQSLSHRNVIHGNGKLNSTKNSTFPIAMVSLKSMTGNDSGKLKKTKRQNSFTVPLKAGHSCYSQILAGQKKSRTSFTRKQIATLESRFLVQKYLASIERVNLANQLKMSDMQVKTWFQNRRTKWRRQEAEEKEGEDKEKMKMMSCYSKCFFARPDIAL